MRHITKALPVISNRSLIPRKPRVAQQRCDKLRRKQRTVETALLQGHQCRVIDPNKACKQIDVDMGDLVGK